MKKILNFFSSRLFIDLFSALLLGGIVFVFLLGTDVINPLNIDWLLSNLNDTPQHYFGWLFYRNAQWNIIPGLFNTLSFPENVSIIYTDSIPILAVLLKLIDSFFVLPEDIQYIGLWSLSCFMLQSMVFVLLCRKFTKSFPILMLCGLFSIFSPVMVYRLFRHSSLMAHWLILLSFLPCVYYDYFQKNKLKLFVFCTTIGFLSIGIHSYFLVHCFVIFSGFILYDYLKTKRFDSLLCIIYYFIGAFFAFFIFGGFSSAVQYKDEYPLLWNMNLNSFFNPYDVSSFFTKVPNFVPEQNEGFSYLGLGFIVLVVLVFSILFVQKSKYKILYKNELIVFLFILFVSVGISVLPSVTFGKYEIISLESNWLVQEYVKIFRSCGRFSWCGIYALLLFCFFVVLKLKIKNRNFIIGLLISICLFLQFQDIKYYLIKKSEFINNYSEYKSPISSELINISKDGGFKHIYKYDIKEKEQMYHIAYWAYKNKLTLNDFYFARQKKAIHKYDNSLMDTIFVFPNGKNIETFDFPFCYKAGIGIFCSNTPINGITAL